jgi:hypothetical protein
MGFFSFLFRRPVFIGDTVFGRLQQESLDKRTGNAWFVTEELLFEPTGKAIGCYIDAMEDGPTPTQQAFYRHIEQHYAELIPVLIPIIEDEFRKWRPDFRINDFATEFWLTGISIPVIGEQSQPVMWDWSFETLHDANHMLTFYMSGDAALPGMQMDG